MTWSSKHDIYRAMGAIKSVQLREIRRHVAARNACVDPNPSPCAPPKLTVRQLAKRALERVVWWLANRQSRKIKRAWDTLGKAMADDAGFREVIESNVTMTVYDASRASCVCFALNAGLWTGEHSADCCRHPDNAHLRFSEPLSLSQASLISKCVMRKFFGTR